VTVGLAPDDLFGQISQHPPCPMIPQFAKSPQQAQFEQRI
jgi:hypothetical protein